MDKFRDYYFKRKTFQVFKSAKDRCENQKNKAFKSYGSRGIKFLLTPEQIRELWIRDRASELKKPSIDRIDNNGNYCVENCRFIEHEENVLRARCKPVQQYDMGYNLIKIYPSLKEAAQDNNLDPQEIAQCCNLERENLDGHYWEWKNPEQE